MSSVPVPKPLETPGGARLKSIDLLRGAAALGVVVHHSVNAGATPPETAHWFPTVSAIADRGRLGVPLFFVISGFCIHARWARQRAAGVDERLDFGRFWRRRLYRLYPPYLVALTLSMGLILLAYLAGKSSGGLEHYPDPKLRWMGMDAVAHVLMLHGFYPVFDRAGGNAPFWTLAREEYFYILYFPLLAFRRRLGLPLSLGGVLLLGLAFPVVLSPWAVPGTGWGDLVQSSSITLWFQWCLGMLAVEGWCGLIVLPRWCGSLWAAALWAGAASVTQGRWEAFSPSLWGMAFFTLLNAGLWAEQRGHWPQTRLVRWLEGVGLFSYSLYLIHHPVRGILKRVLERLIVSGSPVKYAAATVLVVVGGYIAGKMFFWAVEKRFLHAPILKAPALPVPNLSS